MHSINSDVSRKMRWFKPVMMTIAALLIVGLGYVATQKIFSFTNFLGNGIESATATAGELFSLGGERIINPTELHEFYEVYLGGEEVLGHGYGMFHATGFVFIDGPGVGDNENVILRDAVYLGQTFVHSQGVQFEVQADNSLIVRLPKSEYFKTTLAEEPTIENPAEFMAKLGQLFGDITDTTEFRNELKGEVEERILQTENIFDMSECMAAATLTQEILPSFVVANQLVLPQVTVLNARGESISSHSCSSLVGATTSSSYDTGSGFSSLEQVADEDLGEVTVEVKRG